MEYFLYLLIALLAVSFIAERIVKISSDRRHSQQQKRGLPDLTEALKDEKTREKFAAQIAGSIKASPVRPAGRARQTTRSAITPYPQNSADIKVSVEKMAAPARVQQGQHDCPVTMLLKNGSDHGIEIASVQVQFHSQHEDLGAEYTVRAQAGNPNGLAAGETGEFRLNVETPAHAALGRVQLTPVVLVKTGKTVHPVQGSSSCEWLVEPGGREFQVLIESGGVEMAGEPFAIEIITYRDQQIDTSYNGTHRICFSLQGNAATNAAEIPEELDLDFSCGKASTAQVFCFYNTLECSAIVARDKDPGGGEGMSTPIHVRPTMLESFKIEVASPQTNGVPFQGENAITALDAYGNIKVDYRSDTQILVNIEGEMRGLAGAGNTVNALAFNQGVASLQGLTYCSSDSSPEEGKVIQLIASAEGKLGYSDDITILPSLPMSATETQAVIQRLLGFRKRKICCINCEEKLGQLLSKSFQPKYEVTCIETTPEEAADKFTGSLPDVLFLDDGAPPNDGFQILQKICKNPALEGVPVMFLGSPSISENKITDILRTGSVYLTKPPNLAAVRAMVGELVDQKFAGRGRLPTQGMRLPGSEGNSYQIVAKIGEGGMGYIYEARRLRDQQRVIVKYLPPRDLGNINSIMRFVQEAHAVLSFHHENLVCGYDLFMDRNRCFYVMEYIEGESLEQHLATAEKFEPAQATRIVLQVSRALQALEEGKLVHRDIKPANILITPEGLVKLVDFGIAKVTNHKLTTMGIILGTPYYLSPEQIQGSNITIQSDIYSLGATFYHLVTGKVPFQGPDVYSIIHQRLRQNNLRDPREYNPGIPRAIADIIMKMMQLKPRRRYPTPGELIQDLEHLLRVIDSGALSLEEEGPVTGLGEDETSEDENLSVGGPVQP